jgi:hypothetical protein
MHPHPHWRTGAGEDKGIDHNQSWLRFLYDSSFSRYGAGTRTVAVHFPGISQYLPPQPFWYGAGTRTVAVGESTSTACASEGLRIWDSGDAVFVVLVLLFMVVVVGLARSTRVGQQAQHAQHPGHGHVCQHTYTGRPAAARRRGVRTLRWVRFVPRPLPQLDGRHELQVRARFLLARAESATQRDTQVCAVSPPPARACESAQHRRVKAVHQHPHGGWRSSARGRRQTAALLRRRAWSMASTATH